MRAAGHVRSRALPEPRSTWLVDRATGLVSEVVGGVVVKPPRQGAKKGHRCSACGNTGHNSRSPACPAR